MVLKEELAETLGMFAADGCLQENYICIWGNIYEDKEYYNNFVAPLFSKVFRKNLRPHEKKTNSVYGFYLCNKKVVKQLKDIGFSKNKTYTVRIPYCILKSRNKKVYSAFLRGFFDCDGCLSFMKRNGNYSYFKKKFNSYPRIDLKITSKNMIEDISELLNRLYLKHTKYVVKSYKSNEKQQYQISMRGVNRVEDWMNKVGFHNSSKYTKYILWKKYGFCPTRTTLNQRKLILKNKLSIYKFYR